MNHTSIRKFDTYAKNIEDYDCDNYGNDDGQNYQKYCDYCHYTGTYRIAVHSICNLRYKTPK